MDDAALAQLAIDDHTAFEQLYQRYVEQVYRYALARVGNVQDAQDVTTQTFMAALHHIGQFRGDGSFAAWLMRITWRKVIDHYRQATPSLPLEWLDHLPTGDLSPEEIVSQRMRLEAVQHHLDELPREGVEVLLLRTFGGLSVQETAQVIGKSEAATKMMMSRTLHALRERLKQGAYRDEFQPE